MVTSSLASKISTLLLGLALVKYSATWQARS